MTRTTATARTSVCRGCSGALTWSGFYWTHDATGARLCHAERCPARYGFAGNSPLIRCAEATGHAGDHTAPTGDEDGVWAWKA